MEISKLPKEISEILDQIAWIKEEFNFTNQQMLKDDNLLKIIMEVTSTCQAIFDQLQISELYSYTFDDNIQKVDFEI